MPSLLDSAAWLAYNAASVSAQERLHMHIHKPMTDLKFNVAQLLREDIGARRDYTFAEDALPLDDETTLQQLDGNCALRARSPECWLMPMPMAS